MPIASIFASTLGGGIGWSGKLPWRIPEDLKTFELFTRGSGSGKSAQNALIMGRRTFESLPKPLPGRITLVISSQKNLIPKLSETVIQCHSLEDAMKKLTQLDVPQAFIIGGANDELNNISIK
eukprot:Gregarina_sp_Poly_1__3684@NODE_2087_length_2704_cov_43_003034_g1347_i0_p4_GENE_NODE_2087_length_2704_cov_43_003034_g1347_i0NODE_2087_length_2704_cov_43_003034_g1347_i0_p4_ORF_typecomplete_len123_score15_49DHFR_1/PF00186_19/2_5e28_NODE_2087_length_2704_cov_43_003034_g1347_i067435